MTVRLQKFLSEAGVASRREGERLILAGRVTVDGQVVRLLGTKVDRAKNEVALDGRPLKPLAKRFVALNKPPKILCTRRDTHERRTVFDLLPADWGHLYTIGRLDADSEGLILLTNDGEFCQKVAHPSHGLLKTYRVTLAKRLGPETLEQLTIGLRDKGEFLKARRARLLSTNNTRSEAELVLAEGRNREVRRMFKALGFRVLRLQRVAVGPVKLGELPPGKWRVLSRAEIASCLKPPGK
ncbi:MAG TPA: rRNA pseudouridine synthase [Verrucomicrobia bacterium]|nr:rRNA pseudouridine synthase [Pedosphaera sp.]HIM22590.1 rRNA pseudouridine synthase [Verrucomicrobiota bacterium]